MLPQGWKPKDLVTISVPYRGRSEAKYLRKEAADAIIRLFASAKKDEITLCAISGFRSYELQKSVYYKYTRQLGEKTAEMVSAKPGSSEHQTGLSIDISTKSLNYALRNSFANTSEGKWLAENAARFGFILRYPKGREAITGYAYEPWHFRYIGKELAADITKKGVTLEEYYGIAPKNIGRELIAGKLSINGI
jgi:D-alanyl-D-alanine carboxypeptidase